MTLYWERAYEGLLSARIDIRNMLKATEGHEILRASLTKLLRETDEASEYLRACGAKNQWIQREVVARVIQPQGGKFRVRAAGPEAWAVFNSESPGQQLIGFTLDQALSIADAANRVTEETEQQTNPEGETNG